MTTTTRSGLPVIKPRFWHSVRMRHTGKQLFVLALVMIGAAFFSIPLVWMISTAGKDGSLIFKYPPVWIPPEYKWSNYVESWSALPFAKFYVNTIEITLLSVAGVLLSSSIAAFAFARLRFPGRDIMFLLVLATLMLPGQVTMIPQYRLYTALGLVNTLPSLWLQSWFGDAFSIFLLRQYFMTISSEMDDAARIDGCTRFGIFWRVIVPLSKPALAVVGIFQFTFMWNNFFRPLIYINSLEKFPVALGLRLFQDEDNIEIQFMMAQTVLFVLPLLVLFFVAQRHFIQGIVVTGVKG